VLPGFQFRVQDLYDQPDFLDRSRSRVLCLSLVDYQAERRPPTPLTARRRERNARERLAAMLRNVASILNKRHNSLTVQGKQNMRRNHCYRTRLHTMRRIRWGDQAHPWQGHC
jgi:hypothetical protein